MRYISIVETTLWINFNYNKIKLCHLCCFSKILFYRYNLFFSSFEYKSVALKCFWLFLPAQPHFHAQTVNFV